MSRIITLSALILCLMVPAAFAAKKSSGTHLNLTDRQLIVNGAINLRVAQKFSQLLLKYDAAVKAPIYLLISDSRGTAQGVTLLADTIRAINSPVVAVVLTDIYGAGAALAVFADRTVMYRSSGLHFTEVEYEGVRKPKAKTKARPTRRPPPKPSATALYLQQLRTKYLSAFWASVAKRAGMDAKALADAVKKGGFSLSPADAVKKKIAHSIPNRVTYTRLSTENSETKVTTSVRKFRTKVKK